MVVVKGVELLWGGYPGLKRGKSLIARSWKEGFHAANGKPQHALMGGGVNFLFFFLVQSLPAQLAQAKNRDQQLWKPEIHACNW